MAGVFFGILILSICILFHEFGHYLAGLRNGLKYEQFCIGFGKSLFSFKFVVKWPEYLIVWRSVWTDEDRYNVIGSKGRQGLVKDLKERTEFHLRLYPFGGYVKVADHEEADDPFAPLSFWAKTKVLFAGPLMNIVLAVVALTVYQFFFPTTIGFTASQVYWGPTELVGEWTNSYYIIHESEESKRRSILPGTILAEVNGFSMEPRRSVSFDEAISYRDEGEPILYSFFYDGMMYQLSYPAGDLEDHGLKIMRTGDFQFSPYMAPITGPSSVALITAMLPVIIYDQIAGEEQVESDTPALVGPVGIMQETQKQFIKDGMKGILLLLFVITYSVAFLNLIPIPSLDGGRWLLYLYERVFKREIPETVSLVLFGGSALLLLTLGVVVTIFDVIRLFQ